MLGYHGNEIRFYDELLGGKDQWRNAGSPTLLDLLAVRYLLLPEAQPVPGFHQVLGPVTTTPGSPAVLLERDTLPPYVRVVPGAAQASRGPGGADRHRPAISAQLGRPLSGHGRAHARADPRRAGARGRRRSGPRWPSGRPGRMRITLEGAAAKPAYLLIARELVSRLARHGGRKARAGLPGATTRS